MELDEGLVNMDLYGYGSHGTDFEQGDHVKTELDGGATFDMFDLSYPSETGQYDREFIKTEYIHQENSGLSDDSGQIQKVWNRIKTEPGLEQNLCSNDPIDYGSGSQSLIENQIKNEPREQLTPVSKESYQMEYTTETHHQVTPDRHTIFKLESQESDYCDSCGTGEIIIKTELALKTEPDSGYQDAPSGATFIVAPDHSRVPLTDMRTINMSQVGKALMQQEPEEDWNLGSDISDRKVGLLKIEVDDPLHPVPRAGGYTEHEGDSHNYNMIKDEESVVNTDAVGSPSELDGDKEKDTLSGTRDRRDISRMSDVSGVSALHISVSVPEPEQLEGNEDQVDRDTDGSNHDDHVNETDHADTEDPKKISCKQCGRVFKRRNNLTRHQRVHDSAKKVKCSLCNKKFLDTFELKRHDASYHQGIRHRCRYCYQEFMSKASLKRHEGVHTSGYKYQCGKCTKGFHTEGAIQDHLNRHNGVKPYKCSNCKKKFTTKRDMERHFGSCTNTVRYSCTICAKLFKDRRYLRKHEHYHTNKTACQCYKCGKIYRFPSSLGRHMRRAHRADVNPGCSIDGAEESEAVCLP